MSPWGADLRGARRHGTYLKRANLRGADLRGVTLTGARLRRANLSGATASAKHLAQAEGLQGAILPNGTIHP